MNTYKKILIFESYKKVAQDRISSFKSKVWKKKLDKISLFLQNIKIMPKLKTA